MNPKSSEKWFIMTYLECGTQSFEMFHAESMAKARKMAEFKAKERGIEEYSVTKA